MNAVIQEDDICSVTLDFHSGAIERGLWICLAQLNGRSREDIENDRSSAVNVAVLTELLSVEHGSTRLTANAQPNQTCLILCPEYAFGSSDWTRLAELVSKFPRNLILIATFGASPVAAIGTIEDSARVLGTIVHRGWNSRLPDERLINFGAVWVKDANSTSCVLFGKAFPEQRAEGPNLGIVEFFESTEIKFRDLRLLPCICADLLENHVPGGGRTVAQRMASRALQAPAVTTLCTASLLQSTNQASERWQQAIDGLLSALGGANAVLLVCNVATATPDGRLGGDVWRNLTGIYLSTQFGHASQRKEQVGSTYFQLLHTMGWPLRSWRRQLVLGTLRFPPYSVVQALHPWSEYSRYGLEGTLPKYVNSPSEDELCLYCYVSEIGATNGYDLLEDVLIHIESGAEPSSRSLVAQFLQGPFAAAVVATHLPKFAPCLKKCLQGAHALLGTSQKHDRHHPIAWQSQSTRLGQLTVGLCCLALWCSGTKRQGEMLVDLRTKLDTRSPTELLAIFGRGVDGDFDPQNWKNLCIDRTIAIEIDQFGDLPIDAPAPIENAVVIASFGHVGRLILSMSPPNNPDNLPAFQAIAGLCRSGA